MPSNAPPDDEPYASSQDSDFAPDELRAPGSQGSVSEDESEDARSSFKRRRAVTDDDGGCNNSGDEAIIEKGRKRQKRRGVIHEDEGGDGALIKTRRQRAEEKAERHLAASTDPVTIDVDALWEHMKSGKPIHKPDNPASQQAVDEAKTPKGDSENNPPTATQDKDDNPETITIKRTYTFAGRVHTEEKVVPATQQKPASTKPPTPPRNYPPRPTRKAFRSIFEPPLDGASTLPHRPDLDLGLAARRKAAQDAQARKINTVEKSRMDWAGYVDREGIQDELALASKSKDSYNAREAFLARSEAIRDGEAKRARMANRL
ncbi:SWR1-complex protein 5 [Ophiocordyceps camponoti-floridani]|uniref:SWR1-complex protein 5 n=1 Tax=Ophiocordyceps camponoti-floridani TaxID=2030778 RepID=A0A8H4Q4V4_9HYPO|nr:SWR1-complex protein 5 [Ophiocordyceps camponoti-floridani]